MKRICLGNVFVAAALLLALPHAGAAVPRYRVVSRTVLGNLSDIGMPQGLTMDSATSRLYIAGSRGVTVVDVKAHKVVASIPQPERVHSVVLVPKESRGYATIWQPNDVAVLDLDILATIDTIHVQTEFAKGWWPSSIVYEPRSRRLFTFNESSRDFTAIDSHTRKVLAHVPLGGIPGCAVADGKGMVYANVAEKSEMVAIDASTLAVTKRWPVAPGESPVGLAIDVKRRLLFSTCANNKIVIADPDAGIVLSAYPIGKGAGGATYDQGTGLLFTSNGDDGTMTVLQVRGRNDIQVVETVPTLHGARTLALDGRSHHLYFVASTSPDTSGPYDGFGVPTLLELAPEAPRKR